jgi:hypothetical protein
MQSSKGGLTPRLVDVIFYSGITILMMSGLFLVGRFIHSGVGICLTILLELASIVAWFLLCLWLRENAEMKHGF